MWRVRRRLAAPGLIGLHHRVVEANRKRRKGRAELFLRFHGCLTGLTEKAQPSESMAGLLALRHFAIPGREAADFEKHCGLRYLLWARFWIVSYGPASADDSST